MRAGGWPGERPEPSRDVGGWGLGGRGTGPCAENRLDEPIRAGELKFPDAV